MALLSINDLRALFSECVQDFVVDERAGLLDRNQLSKALGCSLSKVDQLRDLPGFPVVKLGVGTPRFDWNDVLAFLKAGHASHLGGT